VAEFCQGYGVTFTGDDSANDELAGLPSDISDGLRKLDIHLEQGFLHMLDVGGAVLDKLSTVTKESAKSDEIGCGTEGSFKQAVAVKSLDPLAVFNIGLATGDPLERTRANETAMEAEGFQQFKDGYPIDPRTFHGDSANIMLLQPMTDGMQVGCVSAKEVNNLSIRAFPRDADPDFMCADVHTSGVGLDAADASKRLDVDGENGLSDGGT